MLNAIRSAARPQQPSLLSYSRPIHIARRSPSTIRFARAAASGPDQPDSNEMDSKKQNEPKTKTLDSMTSFGDGYVTRCDEEGFGGIYGGSKYGSRDDEEEKGHGDVAEFDHDQGCEVKEKEKARHQSKVST